jgi:Tfp pilus assembly protein PilN
MLINKYQINLVRALREQERDAERKKTRMLGFSVFCFGMLVVSLFYTMLQLFNMQATLKTEIAQSDRIQSEYKKYKQTQMLVSKPDLELLDSLQNSRIFWTKKLAALASHLPENYWLNNISFKPPEFSAGGGGYISPQQEQLIAIENYLNDLRADSNYSDIFKKTHFSSTSRSQTESQSIINFEFSSLRQGN